MFSLAVVIANSSANSLFAACCRRERICLVFSLFIIDKLLSTGAFSPLQARNALCVIVTTIMAFYAGERYG